MSIYDDLRQVSSDLHAEFKQGDVRYVPVIVTPSARPDLPTSSAFGTPVGLNAVARPVSTKYVDGTNVVATDKQLSLPNDGTTPDPVMGHFIRINGVDHRIIQIMARPAAGEPVSWTVIVRR